MSDIVPHPDQAPAIAQGDPDRIAWIVEQIADSGFTPGPVGLPWAGRGVVIAQTVKEYSCTAEEAELIVDQAHASLYDVGQSANPTHVERRLLKNRLNVIRRLILSGLKEPKVTTTYMFSKRRNKKTGETTMLKVPKREVVRKHMDVNLVKQLLDIEQMIAKLERLEVSSSTGSQTVEEIFHELRKGDDGNTTETSITRRIESIPTAEVRKFSAAGQGVIQDAMRQESRRKRVNSKPAEKEEPDATDTGTTELLRPGNSEPDEAV
jgi:uncharacterized protein (UPF0335 family)